MRLFSIQWVLPSRLYINANIFQNQGYLSNEYIVRKDLLVAPILTEADSTRGWRSVYLPSPDSWFKFNLRCDETIGSRLSARLPGGSHIEVAARIDADSSQVVDVTPMYIREGGR